MCLLGTRCSKNPNNSLYRVANSSATWPEATLSFCTSPVGGLWQIHLLLYLGENGYHPPLWGGNRHRVSLIKGLSSPQAAAVTQSKVQVALRQMADFAQSHLREITNWGQVFQPKQAVSSQLTSRPWLC